MMGLDDVLTVGRVNMNMDVNGPATSLRDLMGGLNGKAGFATGAGRVRNTLRAPAAVQPVRPADAVRRRCLAHLLHRRQFRHQAGHRDHPRHGGRDAGRDRGRHRQHRPAQRAHRHARRSEVEGPEPLGDRRADAHHRAARQPERDSGSGGDGRQHRQFRHRHRQCRDARHLRRADRPRWQQRCRRQSLRHGAQQRPRPPSRRSPPASR